MSEQSAFHNLIAGRFVSDIIGPAIKSGATDSELMVIVESALVAVQEILHRHYRAIERFAGSRGAA